MKLRMTLATSLAAVALVTLSGCRSGGDSPAPSTSPSTSESATPTAPATLGKAELVGSWEATESDWVVHFNEDGTFVEDFQGIVDFRVGTYDVSGETVSLIGDDGNTDKGTVTGETLVFKLGILTRM